MQHPRRIILTRNENLLITCNATNVNGEFTVKWVAPPGSVRPVSFGFCCRACFRRFACPKKKRVYLSCARGWRVKGVSACAMGSWMCMWRLCLWSYCMHLCIFASICLARIDMPSGLISRDLWALTGCHLVSTATSKG